MEIMNGKATLGDKKISIAIMSSFVVLTSQYLVLIYFNLMETTAGSMIQLFSKLIVGFFYVVALPTVLKRNKMFFFITYFIGIVIYATNYFVFTENWIHLNDTLFPFFFTSLPTFIYIYSLEDKNILMNIMRKTSVVVFFICLFVAILIFLENNTVGEYSMSLSYYTLLPLIFFLNDLFNKFNIVKLFFVVVSTVVILALGSRGAILCVLIFIILKLLFQLKKLTYTKFFIYSVLAIIIIFSVFFIDDILQLSYEFLSNNFGIKSRTLQLFQEESLHLSQRDVIYKNVLHEIAKHPIIGLGVAGDRNYAGAVYVHNILLEIIAHFGVLIGCLLLFTLLFMIIFALKTQDLTRRDLIIIWLCLGLVPLFVSSSYLIELNFWVLLGLVVQNIKFRKY